MAQRCTRACWWRERRRRALRTKYVRLHRIRIRAVLSPRAPLGVCHIEQGCDGGDRSHPTCRVDLIEHLSHESERRSEPCAHVVLDDDHAAEQPGRPISLERGIDDRNRSLGVETQLSPGLHEYECAKIDAMVRARTRVENWRISEKGVTEQAVAQRRALELCRADELLAWPGRHGHHEHGMLSS